MKQKVLQNKFIQSFLNNHDSITFITKDIKKEYMNDRVEKGSFIYYPNLKLIEGGCSKCFYGLNRTNGDEVAIKFQYFYIIL